jgi:hypothetical protein
MATCRWKDTIKIPDPKETALYVMDWINLAQNKDQGRIFMKTLMKVCNGKFMSSNSCISTESRNITNL